MIVTGQSNTIAVPRCASADPSSGAQCKGAAVYKDAHGLPTCEKCIRKLRKAGYSQRYFPLLGCEKGGCDKPATRMHGQQPLCGTHALGWRTATYECARIVRVCS